MRRMGGGGGGGWGTEAKGQGSVGRAGGGGKKLGDGRRPVHVVGKAWTEGGQAAGGPGRLCVLRLYTEEYVL